MKFTIESQHGVKQSSVIVWDAEKNEVLCTFVQGEFETEDEEIADKLLELGYNTEDSKTEVDTNIEEKELRAKAKSLGVKHYHVKGIDTLIAEIAELEAN